MGKTGSLRDYMADIAQSNIRSGGDSGGGSSSDYDIVELTFGTAENPVDTINYQTVDANISFTVEDGFQVNDRTNSVIRIRPADESETVSYKLHFENRILSRDTIIAVLKVEDYTYDGNETCTGKFQILVNNTLYKIEAYYTVMAG